MNDAESTKSLPSVVFLHHSYLSVSPEVVNAVGSATNYTIKLINDNSRRRMQQLLQLHYESMKLIMEPPYYFDNSIH